ncbi:MAG: lipopolysaccharide kinase InaA family protein [Marinifilaceae bacterium]
MKLVINNAYKKYYDKIKEITFDFDSLGTLIYDGRNQIRNIELDDIILNIKSFKKPNVINKLIYKYFRKSKAARSYEFANKLISLDLNTPINIAYIETGKLFLSKSYYICEYFENDFSMLEVLEERVADRENVIRQFANFTYSLHKKGVLHLDYSPGNILIKKLGDNYIFSLVDINRMKFLDVSLEMGIRNFSKLWNSEDMLKFISEEYAKLNNVSYEYVYDLLKGYDSKHKDSVEKRKKRKKIIKSILHKK